MKVILVDAMNLAMREHHTHRELATKKNEPTGVLHGVLSNLLYFNKAYPEHHFVFAFEGGKTWRHELAPEIYKVGRGEHEEVDSQVSALKEILDIFGIKNISVKGYEADDIIGILATALEERCKEVLIYSGDKDFYQLISKRIKVVRKKYKVEGYDIIDEKRFAIEYEITPKEWVKLRAFCGDKSDGMKPIVGIGPGKALKILACGADPSVAKFGHLPVKTRLLLPNLRQHWDAVHMCYRLSHILRKVEDAPNGREILSSAVDVIVQQPGRDKYNDKEIERRTAQFIKVAVEYELMYLLSQRHVFWNIP